jgi:hypothetical protein
MENVTVLARVAWPKTIAYVSTIPVLLLVGYVLLSDRPLSQVFSIENWMTPTGWTPFPVLGIVCIFIFGYLVVHRFLTLLSYSDRYIWTKGNVLMSCSRRIATSSELDPTKIQFTKVGVSKYLTIETYDRGGVAIPVTFGKFDEVELTMKLKEWIQSS